MTDQLSSRYLQCHKVYSLSADGKQPSNHKLAWKNRRKDDDGDVLGDEIKSSGEF